MRENTSPATAKTGSYHLATPAKNQVKERHEMAAMARTKRKACVSMDEAAPLQLAHLYDAKGV